MAEFQEVMKHRKRMCASYNGCYGCVFRESNCVVTDFILSKSKKAEEIIMKWAEEHPLQTNADKFKEVFGLDAYKEASLSFCPFINDGCSAEDCEKCGKSHFWQQEYKEPKGE